MDITRTFSLVLSNLIMFSVLFYALRYALSGKFKTTNLIWILPLIIIFCLLSFWGPDWFHYYESYILLKEQPELPSQLEPFYKDLIEWTPNYWYFRLTIWGGAVILTYLSFSILDLDMGVASFYFVICSLIWFSYGRVSLAFASSLFGFSLLISDKKACLLRVIGVCFILLSLLFHKSAVFIIVIICMTLILARMNKGIFKILILLFPLFAIILPILIGGFLSTTIDEESEFAQTVTYGQSYLSEKSSGLHFGSLGKIPSKYLEWIPKYIVAYICFKAIKDNNNIRRSAIHYFCIMTFMIIFVSSFFIFDIGYSTSVIFSRFQRYAILPEVVVLTYFYSNNCYKTLTRKAQFFFIASSFYTLVYQSYCVF